MINKSANAEHTLFYNINYKINEIWNYIDKHLKYYRFDSTWN